MPVEKYRDARDMPRVPRVRREGVIEAIAAVWDWAHVCGPRQIVRGVRKFRTPELAQEARLREDVERMRALRAERHAK